MNDLEKIGALACTWLLKRNAYAQSVASKDSGYDEHVRVGAAYKAAENALANAIRDLPSSLFIELEDKRSRK